MKMKKKRPGNGSELQKRGNLIADLLFDLTGGLLYSAGVYTFAKDAGFAPGGISGLSLMANHLWGLPLGVTAVLLNIPLVLISLKFVGRRFLFRTARSMLFCTLILDLIAPLTPVYSGSPVVAAVLSGAFLGAGMSVFYRRGSSSGGTDLLTVTVKALCPRISMGFVTLLTDFLIIGAGWYVFGNASAVLYGLLATAVNSAVIDLALSHSHHPAA